MLRGHTDNVAPASAAPFGEPAQGQIVGLSRSAGKDYLPSARSDRSRQGTARLIDRLLGVPTETMTRAAGVPKPLAEIRQHRVDNPRVHSGRRVIVKINWSDQHTAIVNAGRGMRNAERECRTATLGRQKKRRAATLAVKRRARVPVLRRGIYHTIASTLILTSGRLHGNGIPISLQKGLAMALVETEQVMVVPTSLFHELGYFQGFSREVDQYIDELLSPENISYRPRSSVEEDPTFKQLIPYILLRGRDASGSECLFQYTRGKGQGEKRLRTKRSVGIGGHICSDDASGEGEIHPYQEGMRRELREEVSIQTTYRDDLVGLLNDDETEVGRVHLGVVHVFDLATLNVTPREDDISNSGFQTIKSLLGELEQFESWSQICLTALFGSKRNA